MKIAVCFSGQIRTGIESADSIKSYLGQYLNQVDFFIHTWDVESRSIHTLEEEGLERNTKNIIEATTNKPINPSKIAKMREIYNPTSIRVDNFNSYQIERKRIIKENGYTGETIPLFQSLYESNKMKIEYEERNNFKYDLVLKMRPDHIFNETSSLEKEINRFDLSSKILYSCDPLKKHPNRVEDILWATNSETMNIVCDFLFYKEKEDPSTMEYPTGYDYNGYIWQIQLKKYIDEQNIVFKRFKDNRVFIYRDFHIERKIWPAMKSVLV